MDGGDQKCSKSVDLDGLNADWVFSSGGLYLSVVCCDSCSPSQYCNILSGNLRLQHSAVSVQCVLLPPTAFCDPVGLPARKLLRFCGENCVRCIYCAFSSNR